MVITTTDPRRDLPALDRMLVGAAVSGSFRALPAGLVSRFITATVRRPDRLLRRSAELCFELSKISVGGSDRAPSKGDRRFSDRAWAENLAYRRILQAYLAICEKAHHLLAEAAVSEHDRERLRLLLENALDAAAPSNWITNPVVVKELIDTGGASLVRGVSNLVVDMAFPPRVPSTVDKSAFRVGTDLAVSPGQVVARTELFELIQYQPRTERVHAIPLLMVPPTINKYYALDLAPGRSVVEHLLDAGCQVFMISWRNPTAQFAEWGFETYVSGIIRAFDTVRSITESDLASLWGTCSGGILTTLAVSHLTSVGRADQIASLALPVTILDQRIGGSTSALLDPRLVELAKARSRRAGVLDGARLTELFAWLRPNDLVWNYWVSNYLLGRTPPAFDILYWNADATRMPARLHADFLDLAVRNSLVEPDSYTMLGTHVDLGKIDVDAFIIGAAADHITPWQACYRNTQLLGSKCEFVLSNSGHVAAMINPPGNPKAAYQHGVVCPADPAEFASGAESLPGSWWPTYSAWLTARSGDVVLAPSCLGDTQHPPLDPAPGLYVHDN